MTGALSALELAWAVPLGREAAIPALARGTALRPREALEHVVRDALQRPPCVVSFSGGRDSSTVLALATFVARRDGLPEPIPATNCFPGVPSSHENDWQELVVRHLGLTEWVRLQFTDELDVIGPVASAVLRRHGLLAPFNSHFHVPLLEVAAGGALLTGIGGDELFEPTQRAVLARLLYARRLPRRRQLRALARDALPRSVRARIIAGEPAFRSYSWLRPATRAAIARAHAYWFAREPVSYAESVTGWWWPSRLLQCNLAAKRLIAADHDALIAHPFADPRVLVAYGASRGAPGPPGRTWALRELVGDLLPRNVIERSTKSSFDAAFWTGTARSFATGWTGSGVDPELVDPEALRREWARSAPDGHSFALLQQAFLASSNQPARAIAGGAGPGQTP